MVANSSAPFPESSDLIARGCGADGLCTGHISTGHLRATVTALHPEPNVLVLAKPGCCEPGNTVPDTDSCPFGTGLGNPTVLTSSAAVLGDQE